ncbi:MAG: hypothetical protein ACKVS6_10205, partial [Planctomycetota bacterium]
MVQNPLQFLIDATKGLPRFATLEEARTALFAERDQILARFLAELGEKLQLDYTPESLKRLEKWCLQNGPPRPECFNYYYPQAVALYIAEMHHRHLQWTWSVEESTFGPGQYSISVGRPGCSVEASQKWPPDPKYDNKRMQYMWRQYKQDMEFHQKFPPRPEPIPRITNNIPLPEYYIPLRELPSAAIQAMGKRELRKFHNEFLDAIPARVELLRRIVTSTPDYESWTPDESTESLVILSQWFGARVSVYERTEEELEAERRQSGAITAPKRTVLTDFANALSKDVGIYLALVFMKQEPTLTWKQCFAGKRNVYYGKTCIAGFPHKVMMSPIDVSRVITSGIAEGRDQPDRFVKILDVWREMIERP